MAETNKLLVPEDGRVVEDPYKLVSRRSFLTWLSLGWASFGGAAAIMGAAFFDFRTVSKRNRSRLVELAETRVGFGVPVNQSFKGATVGTSLRHEHFVIAEQDLRVNHSLAIRANTAREFIKDVVSVLLANTVDNWLRYRNW